MRAPPGERRVDRRQLRALLGLYFQLATRGRASQLLSGRRRSPARVLVVVSLVHVLMGLSVGFVAFTRPDVFAFSLIATSMTFFVIGLGLVAESGDVLFNRMEADVLGPRPVPSRTLLAAKAGALAAHALLLTLALNAFPAVFGLACRGARPWFPLVHLLTASLVALACAAGVVFVYGLVVRFVNRDRFDEVAAWAQVTMSVAFIVGYQVLPRIAERSGGLSLSLSPAWLLPLPPAWFAALEAVVAGGGRGPLLVTMALGSVVATVALAGAALGRLAAGHAEGLSVMREVKSSPARRAAPERPPARARVDAILDWPVVRSWVRDPVERAAFRLVWAYAWTDREVRTRLFPSLTACFMFPLIAVASGPGGSGTFLAYTGLGLLGLLTHSILEVLRVSSHHAAAEIFVAAPLAGMAPLFHGARKAVMVGMLVPSIVLTTPVVALALRDAGEALALLLVLLPVLPPLSLLPGVLGPYVPLARPMVRGDQSKNVAVTMMAMIPLALVIAAGHVAGGAGLLAPLVAVEIVIAAGVHALLLRAVARRPMPVPE